MKDNLRYDGITGYNEVVTLSDPITWKYFPRIHAIYKIRTMLEYITGSSVLDVGCGNGVITKKIRDNFPNSRIVGIDSNKKAVEIGKKTFDLDLFVSDIYNMGFSDNAFDTVLLFDTLEHIDKPYSALRAISRVTKHRIIISVPNRFSIIHDCYQIFDEKRLYKMCSEFGETTILPGLNNLWILKYSIISTLVGSVSYMLKLDEWFINRLSQESNLNDSQHLIAIININ